MDYGNLIRYVAIVLIGIQALGCNKNKKSAVSSALKQTAKEKLQFALENSSEWEKVHAAEYILDLGYPNKVYDIFIEEEKQKRNEHYYRIGIWRVLHRAAITAEEKKQWLDSISRVYKKQTSPDCMHAAESLAKLKVSPRTISVKVTDSILKSDYNPMWLFTYWGTAYTSDKEMHRVENGLTNIILEPNKSALVKKIALYALFTMKNMGVQNWDALLSKTLNEADSSRVYSGLLTCILANTPKDSLSCSRVLECRKILEKRIPSLQNQELSAVLNVYKDIATEEDIPLLTSFMDNRNTEVTMAAAHALLRIDNEGR